MFNKESIELENKYFLSLYQRGISKGFKNLYGALKKVPPPPPFIHVGGTNGKGSLCEYLFNGLTSNNLRAALFTSPHVLSVTERIRANTGNIELEHLYSLKKDIDKLFPNNNFTFFEYSLLMFLIYLKQIKADIAIIEVGLGGKLDSTNILDNKLACALTSIAFDHVEILGNNLNLITEEKLGITRENIPLYIPFSFKTKKQVIDYSQKNSIPLNIICAKNLNLLQKGLFQKELASLALELLKDLGYLNSQEAIEKTTIKARLEYIKEDNILLDTCHNYASFKHLVTYLKQEKLKFKALYFSLMQEKAHLEIFSLLEHYQKKTNLEIIYVNLNMPRARQCEQNNLAKTFGFISEKQFIKENFKDCLICGSFHLIFSFLFAKLK